ncbi:glycosyltransferase family 4 protein [Runella slithyformis]|uniref:Glycosyl transferase group 1 n=1 Tax=Runella slithyformis (strain ATCC 29530 / DSM 19594 / LMG 11500 / NCIMB 11436 / LSU 4) TaxID=761193 RepID=A0A7U3ZN84_RUNSL|nr:glycosyltransferase family 4 protein [Runella slithyformis]AEI50299.1 glycosyl transferase group 1 [Runella slithyformis DSM 19594]
MKIVHICNYFQPKLGYQEFFLAREQQRMGHDVDIITSDRYMPFPDYNHTVKAILGDRIVGPGFFIEFGIKVHRLPTILEYANRVWLIGFEKELLKLNPELIICHNLLHFMSVRLLLMHHRLKSKLIFDDHTTQNVVRQGYLSPLVYGLFRFFCTPAISRIAIKVVGISDSCRHVLTHNFGFKPQQIEIIPLGSDPELFYPNEALRQQTRKKLGVSHEVLVLYTGKISEYKQCHLIIDALNELPFTTEKVAVFFAGGITDKYRSTFEDALTRSKHPARWVGSLQVNDLTAYYNAADIAVWPADTTISTLDASACGCPIICVDYLSERYKNNNGIGIKENNLDALKEALYRLIISPDLRAKMRINAVELIEKEYSWAVIAARFTEV